MAASPHLLIDSGAAIGLPSCKSDRPLQVHRSRPALGTLFGICLVGAVEEQLSAVAETCLAEVQRQDRRLSRYNSQSEIARLNREAVRDAVVVDHELAALLTRCYTAWQRTDGWFDIAANHAWQIKNRRVEFLELGAQLDFSSIGKGYALDRAAMLLDEFHVSQALLHAGTHSVLAKGNSPTGRGWQVRVRNPASDAQGTELLVELDDEALSVLSADADLHCPVERRSVVAAVAVVAATGFEAEALSTALLCMGRERAMDYLSTHTGRLSVAWLDEVTFPHEGKWRWLTEDR